MIDPQIVQRACMADLGRLRQEELPLSDKERKGPSYAPEGRNGTDHIAPALKRGLEAKWNSGQIEDEETAQIVGLSIEDSRPWAKKIAQDYLVSHARESAPPLIQQQSRGKKRAKTSHPVFPGGSQFGALGGIVPPGGTVKRYDSSKRGNKPSSHPSSGYKYQKNPSAPNPWLARRSAPRQERVASVTSQSLDHLDLVPKGVTATQNITTSNGSSQPTPKNFVPVTKPPVVAKMASSEGMTYQGNCKIKRNEPNSIVFLTSFTLKFSRDVRVGHLIFSAQGRDDKTQDVLSLKRPVVNEDVCSVEPIRASDGPGFLLKFPHNTDANKFGTYFESLQKMAARENNKQSNGQTSIELAKRPGNGEARSNQTSSQSESSERSQTSGQNAVSILSQPTNQGHAENNVAVSTNGTTPRENNTRAGDDDRQSSACLVDVSDAPQKSQTEHNPEFGLKTIEDAADQLHNLINSILPQASAAGVLLSEDTIHDIEETAVDNWLSRGFLESETDDMKSEMLDLLHVLVRIKRKTQARKAAISVQQLIGPFQDFSTKDTNDNDGKTSPRIQYSPKEITNLKANVRLADLENGPLTPRQTPTPGKPVQKTPLSHVPKSMTGCGGAVEAKKADATVMQNPPSPMDVDTPMANTASKLGPSLSQMPPTPGLQNSTWAQRDTQPQMALEPVSAAPKRLSPKAPAFLPKPAGLLSSRWAKS